MLTDSTSIAATDKCDTMDVAEAEEVVQNVADVVQDLVVNFDVTDI